MYRVSELELVFFSVSYDANKFGKVMVPVGFLWRDFFY